MATYAFGDIQGCYETLGRLLARVRPDRRSDRLWLVGDLVNRGPRSADVLRWAADQGDRVTAVLGNHDIHLLARAEGLAEPKRRDTLDDVLEAPDRDDLLAWLRARPILHRESAFVLVHAGILPEWSVETAAERARELETALRDETLRRSALARRPAEARWDDALAGTTRLAVLRAAFTSLRTVRPDGTPHLEFTGPPAEAPPGCVPWFDVASRRSRDATVVFGHWAALGLLVRPDVIGLDTGCVWGHALTAVRLEDRAVFQERAVEGR